MRVTVVPYEPSWLGLFLAEKKLGTGLSFIRRDTDSYILFTWLNGAKMSEFSPVHDCFPFVTVQMFDRERFSFKEGSAICELKSYWLPPDWVLYHDHPWVKKNLLGRKTR